MATIKIIIAGLSFEKRVSIDKTNGESELERAEQNLRTHQIKYAVDYDTFD
jgi:hypothetical protein